MGDVAGSGSSILSESTFRDMIKAIDKDGDGSVSKDEYKGAYLGAFPKTTEEEFEAIWKKIDADGDGNLTVDELAAFYGFKLGGGGADEMNDDDILKMLQLQAAVELPKEEAPKKPVVKERDTTIVSINVDKGKYEKDSPEASMVELLRGCKEAAAFPDALKNILQTLNPAALEADKSGTACKLNLRIEDAEKKTPLHLLAAVPTAKLEDKPKAYYTAAVE